MAYLAQMKTLREPAGCFLCRYVTEPARDARNFVLHRSPNVLVLLNRYPYSNGHVMVAPVAHVARFDDLSKSTMLEMFQCIQVVQKVLREAVAAEGFNIGMNLGSCAGAGLPDHLHWHVVPRWSGDTNFMGIVGDVRVVPQALADTFAAIRMAWRGAASTNAARSTTSPRNRSKKQKNR